MYKWNSVNCKAYRQTKDTDRYQLIKTTLCSYALLLCLLSFSGLPYTARAADDPVPGSLAVTWIHGSPDCSKDTNPPIQVHRYNTDTYILRENKCTHFEAPFIYLLFGQNKVYMQDTGATADPTTFPIRDQVQQIIRQWLTEQNKSSIELVIAHSHSHGDHVMGDVQFRGQPNTTMIGYRPEDVQRFFNITNWPTQQVTYDLGQRVLDIIPIPGHEQAHIAVYDRQTHILLTGDTLYPGFLFISNWNAYRASLSRLVDFARSHSISHILGAHIEMSKDAGQAYERGTKYQPNEHQLPLGLSDLIELNTAVEAMGATPNRQIHKHFIIDP